VAFSIYFPRNQLRLEAAASGSFGENSKPVEIEDENAAVIRAN
jgi:hypothetical protein